MGIEEIEQKELEFKESQQRILAESLTRLDDLLNKARERMYELKFRNVRLLHGDGSRGWTQYAPFDGIIVSAAPIGVPDTLLQQLSPDGGRLIIPVGNSQQQVLLLITREAEEYQHEQLDMVSFVPMIEGIG